jgi:hypothetical protein
MEKHRDEVRMQVVVVYGRSQGGGQRIFTYEFLARVGILGCMCYCISDDGRFTGMEDP